MFIIVDNYIFYYMDFLNIINDYINIEQYYKKLKNFEYKELENLYCFINIKWTRILNNIDNNEYSNKRLEKYIDFNKNLNNFIDSDIVIALFVKNIIEKY
tara:strand:+ start:1089 stop:1388 length:300 start_codon:yes stop_codon:yes gene_type:complete